MDTYAHHTSLPSSKVTVAGAHLDPADTSFAAGNLRLVLSRELTAAEAAGLGQALMGVEEAADVELELSAAESQRAEIRSLTAIAPSAATQVTERVVAALKELPTAARPHQERLNKNFQDFSNAARAIQRMVQEG